MKIYALTDMTEMPKNCFECDCYIFDTTMDKPCLCGGKNRFLNQGLNRPDWCPLRTEKEIKEEL